MLNENIKTRKYKNNKKTKRSFTRRISNTTTCCKTNSVKMGERLIGA